MNCFCFLRNASVPLEDGDTAYRKRFGKDFNGPLIAFGSEISYLPIRFRDKKRTHAFSTKELPGIFLGYEQIAGGGFSGDLFIVDWEEMFGASSIESIHIKTIKHQEVTQITNAVPEGAKLDICSPKYWRFPCATGALRQPGYTQLELPSSEPFGAGGNSLASDSDEEPHDLQEQEVGPAKEELEEPLKLDPDGMPSPAGDAAEVLEKDFWTTNGSVLICHHRVPRTNLFTPTDPDCPMPTKYLDVTRRTYTSIETEQEKCIEDFWNVDGSRALTEEWVGKTIFEYRHFPPKKDHCWVAGRETKIQETTRAGNVWPEVWKSLSPKKKEKAIKDWEILKPKLDEARAQRGVDLHIPWDDKEFPKLLKECEAALKQPAAPAMPLIATSPEDMAYAANSYLGLHGQGKRPKSSAAGNCQAEKSLKEHKRDYWHLCNQTKPWQLYHDKFSSSAGGNSSETQHVEKITPKGFVNEEWYACVHTPLPISKALDIPEAKDALGTEWGKLEKKTAWDVSRVRPRQDVINESNRKKKTVHFGS